MIWVNSLIPRHPSFSIPRRERTEPIADSFASGAIVMAELIIQTGKHQGKKIDLAGLDCIIGRHESCKIRIASGDVSKQHCRLTHKGDGLFAQDLGSRNGTYVNDVLLTEETRLNPGDLLRVGPMVFQVARSAPPPAAAKTKPAQEETDDDQIAAWLSEGGDLEKSGGDTTIVIPSPAVQESEEEQSPPENPADSQLKSVRVRAQEIIEMYHKKKAKG